MSLVNRMLQDLDRRHASASERARLPQDLRSLPPPPERARWPLGLALALALVLAVAVAAWVWFQHQADPERLPVRAHAPTGSALPPPDRVPVPAAPPESEFTAQGAVAPPVAVVASDAPIPTGAPPDPILAASGRGLRLAPALAVVSEPQPPVAAAPPAPLAKASTPPAPVVSVKKPPPSSPANAAATAPSGAAPAAITEPPARIDKRERGATPGDAATANYRRGVAYLNQGRAPDARQAFEAALAEDAGYAPAREALAALLAESGRGDEARALLLEGLSRNAAQPRLALPLARLALARDDVATALVALSSAAPAAQDDAQFRGLYAAALARGGRHREAVAEYQAALRLVPAAGVWWMGLGLSLEAEGRGAEARDALRRAQDSGSLTPEVARFVEQRLR